MSYAYRRRKKLKENHLWFCKHSRAFVGIGYGRILSLRPWVVRYGPKYKIKDLLYWPIAWGKFMYFSVMKHNLDKLKEGQAIVWWIVAIILAGNLAVWFLTGEQL